MVAIEERFAKAGRRAVRLRNRETVTSYLYLSPYLVFLLLFGLAPILYSLYLSFTSTTGNGPSPNALSNFTAAARDFRFAGAAKNVGLYTVLWVPTLIVLVFVAAFLLHARPGRIATVLRVIFYIPGSLAGSAAVLVWLFMFDPSVSPFKPIYHLLGLSSVNQVLAPGTIVFAIVIMALSTGAGAWIVIIYGALRSVSRELIEAAQLDGCGRLRTAWSIELPLVRKYAVLIGILGFATATQVFVEPTLLYSSGVGFISETWSINELSYFYAFGYGRFGVSAALSLELFVVSLILAVVVIFRTSFYSQFGEG